jgi:predicted alpha/beta hydrolase family esterase
MKTADADLLIVPGLGDSDPDHWQSRWQSKLSTARRVTQNDWDLPDRDLWVETLVETVATCRRPVVLIAHSLGVLAVVHAAWAFKPQSVAGAFLVAPPDLDREGKLDVLAGFAPMPRLPLPFPATLVGSDTDPYCSPERSFEFAQAWGAAFVNAGDAGHINVASGHGPWPEGLMRFAGFLSRL